MERSESGESSTEQPVKRSRKLAWLDAEYYTVNWFRLPARVRSLVIDQMDVKTRCLFASSSTACYKDAIDSENYMYGIEIGEDGRGRFYFNVWHSNEKPTYRLSFENCGNQTSVKYRVFEQAPIPLKSRRIGVTPNMLSKIGQHLRTQPSPQMKLKWQKFENGSCPDVAVRYLKDFLNKFEKNLKMFRARVDKFPFEKFDLLRARNLEKLEILTKDQGDDLVWLDFVHLEMLSTVTGVVQLLDVPLRLDEIVELKAAKIQLHNDMNLLGRHVNKYLKKWVRGKLHANLRKVHLKNGRYTFLRRKSLTRGLDVIGMTSIPGFITKFKLRSPARPGEIAKIHFNKKSFFMAIEDENLGAGDAQVVQNFKDEWSDDDNSSIEDLDEMDNYDDDDDDVSLEDQIAMLRGDKPRPKFRDIDFQEYFEESDLEFDQW